MFLNAVILVLQEMLEAALLVSVMLVFTCLLRRVWGEQFSTSNRWLVYALIAGVVGAWLYAYSMPYISQWFDYVGQEVVNASLQLMVLIGLIIFSFLRSYQRTLVISTMVGVVALSIIREASEIILYITGIASQPEHLTSVLLGGCIGAGIGISTGVLLFYSLISLNIILAFRISMLLLAMVAGNMAAQAVQLLTQADWLPFSRVLWNTSGLLPEHTILGQLLYALVGYEATPSKVQVICYLAAVIIIGCSSQFRFAWSGKLKQIKGSGRA